MVGEQRFNAFGVHAANEAGVCQIAFLFQRFLRQNVTFESVFTFDFSCSGKGEPLFGTGISLQFRPFSNIILVNE